MKTAYSEKRNKVNEISNTQIKTHTQIITSQKVKSVKKNPKIIKLQGAKYANFPKFVMLIFIIRMFVSLTTHVKCRIDEMCML